MIYYLILKNLFHFHKIITVIFFKILIYIHLIYYKIKLKKIIILKNN